MMMVCHHLNPSVPEDVAFAESRIRGETISAEDILHDIGALSMYSSDSQAMGRVGEASIQAWQTADKMKKMYGGLSEAKGHNDNLRVKRYLAKLTINPGFIAYSLMGDVNASIPTTEPVYYRPMFGAMGKAKTSISVIFTSKLALRKGLKNRAGVGKKLFPVRNCRKIGKQNMILNNALPKIEIDPESFVVKINGKIAKTQPSKVLSLSRLYNLF